MTETRRALHAIAELLLAGPQHQATGEIALRVVPGGFATAFTPDLVFDGAAIVAGERRVEVAGRSFVDVAVELGLVAAAPDGVYPDGSGADPVEPIVFDPAAARTILDAFALGDTALRRFAPDADPVLWPEHFDVGITVDEVNYGLAPGDDFLPEPYAYVGPFTQRTGEFWNAPFGAARPVRELATVDAVVTFFADGRHHL